MKNEQLKSQLLLELTVGMSAILILLPDGETILQEILDSVLQHRKAVPFVPQHTIEEVYQAH